MYDIRMEGQSGLINHGNQREERNFLWLKERTDV